MDLYIVCLILVTVGISISFADEIHDCATVKNVFERKNIGSKDQVPDNPISGSELSVCLPTLKGSSNQKSCCSQETEVSYMVAGEKYLMEHIRARNGYLKNLIVKHLDTYQEKIHSKVKEAENSSSGQLTDWYSIPLSEHKHPLTNLFGDIDNYIKRTQMVSMSTSVSKFFDTIFPVMYKNIIHDRTSATFTHHIHHCLSRNRKNFHPKPFGDFPDRIVATLNNALSVTKSYIDALAMFVEAINTADSIILEDSCKQAITRLHYCSHCQGVVDIKPCKGFCLDVMRGCLTKLSEIGPEWNDLITSVEALVKHMNGANSIEEALHSLVNSISDAIMSAMVTAPQFYRSVQDYCPFETSSSGGEGTVKPAIPTRSSSSKGSAPPSENLYLSVMQVALDLVDSKDMFSHIADDVCTQAEHYEQNPFSGDCWNGTDIARYQRRVVDTSILSQARNNPEVKVSLLLDPKLRNLKDKLGSTSVNLQSHQTESTNLKDINVMVSDDSFSGDKPRTGQIGWGKEVTLVDDEDWNDDELSGSGSGSGQELEGEPNVVIPPRKETRPTYETEKNKPFGPDNRTPQSKQNLNPPGGAASPVFSSLTLLLLTVLALLWMR